MDSVYRECCICEGCFEILITDQKFTDDQRFNRSGICNHCGSIKQDWFSIKCNYKHMALFGTRWNMEPKTIKVKDKNAPYMELLNKLIEKAKQRYLTSN